VDSGAATGGSTVATSLHSFAASSLALTTALKIGLLKAGVVSPRQTDRAASRRHASPKFQLSLLGGFSLRRSGNAVDLPLGAQRLVAFLALNQRPLLRGYVAGTLWLDAGEERSTGRLRSTVWRLGPFGHVLIQGSRTHVQLGDSVQTDWSSLSASYRRLLDPSADLPAEFLASVPISSDLLPDWYDEWVIVERERFRQLRLHALEVLCTRLTAARMTWLAVEAGLAAVAAEPLRESAHRALIAAHLAEGNRSEAVRQFQMFQRLLREELGEEPSELMATLVRT
jgi:DNA-binding SARP family transcriptional activator